MKRIALCGNIASGKSTVQKMLEDKGFKVLDTDAVSHDLLTVKNKPLYEAFKNYDVFKDGEFSRYKTGQLIFADEDARLKIAAIMHPQIKEEILKFFEKNNDEDLLFVGIPLLFEANMQDIFDKIIFIYTDDNIRLERLINRNHYSLEHAKARINSQMPQEQKIDLSDFVLNNDGSVEDLENSLSLILKKL